jgi:type II secretory pathway pseudopilin PulG
MMALNAFRGRTKHNHGMTLIELLASCGLVAFVIGLSVTPMMQMRKLEKKAEFQTALNTAHQIAVQKARNVTYLKQKLGLLPPPGTPPPTAPVPETAIERCFGGRGTNCNVAPIGVPVEDTFVFKQLYTYSTQSKITITTACQPTKCTKVSVQVATAKISGSKDVDWKAGNALTASFDLPAVSLGSRQEIDFSGCTGAGKVITGIDYETLVANCVAVTGNTTCTGVATAGPVTTIGQPNPNDPANCQPAPALTCPNGMAVFGMVGSPQCVGALSCTDPLSTNCTPPPPPVCNPNWQPAANTQCSGAAFTQTDANNCPGSVAQQAVGTNPAVCVAGACSLAGAVKWPNPITGPCGVASAAGTAAPGSSATIVNENLGYYGSLSATCQDNTPAANAFNMAAATSSCSAILCSGIAPTLEWSNLGIKSAVAGAGMDTVGPWNCSGPQVASNSPPGSLISVNADPSARAIASNNVAGKNGTATVTCVDPGPVAAPRSGVLVPSAVSCTDTAGPCPPGQVMGYSWVMEFMLAPDRVTWDVVGGTNGFSASIPDANNDRKNLCDAYNAQMPNKHQCGPWEPPTGPKCGVIYGGKLPNGVTPPPTCHAPGYNLWVAGGADDTLCVSVSPWAVPNPIGSVPSPECCSGSMHPTFTFADTIGSGRCGWVCD